MNVDPRHFARVVIDLGERRNVYTCATIYNVQGLKVLDKGMAINAGLYERLTEHPLSQPLAGCLSSQPSIDGEVLRRAAQALAAQEPLFGAMLSDAKQRDVLLQELALVPLPPALAFQLTVVNETQPELWMHALRSALMAGWLGLRASGVRHDARMLAAAGLVHDLGLLHLDPVLLAPEEALDRDQRRQLYSHPLVTAMLLQRHHEFPKEVLTSVLEHHERLDGSGYPRQLSGDAVSPWGRVLALTELVGGMCGTGRQMPARRAALALRMMPRAFDPELVALLAPLLGRVSEPVQVPEGSQPVAQLAGTERLFEGLVQAAEASLAGLDDRRREVVQEAVLQAQQSQRALSAAGASAVQLSQLGDEVKDGGLVAELFLVAQEVQWQLRALVRALRRGWRLADGEVHPDWLGAWLADADALIQQHLPGS